MPQRVAVFALAAIALFGFSATAMAQPYPGRTVTIVCPYPAGGPTDQTARVIADFLSKKFNQSFIRREHHRRRYVDRRHQPRHHRPRPTATRCCCTTFRSPPTPRCTRTCRSTPKKT